MMRRALFILGCLLAGPVSADRPTPTVHAQHVALFYCSVDQPDPLFTGTLTELADWMTDPNRAPVDGLGVPGQRWPNLWLRVVEEGGSRVCELTWQTDESYDEVIEDLQGFDVTSQTETGATGTLRATRPCCEPRSFELLRLESNLYRLRLPAVTRR